MIGTTKLGVENTSGGIFSEPEEFLWESSHADPAEFLTILRHEQKSLARNSDHYRQIGQALSVAEAAAWNAGIIAPFPTFRIRARRLAYSDNLETFLRKELTGVPTTTLEFYVEDLDNLTDDSSSLESLSVSPLSFLERTGFFLLFAPAVYLISGLFLARHIEFGAAWLAALIPLFSYLALVSILASDTYRRASFSIILGKEILRRRGGDSPGASNLRICPT